MEDTLFRACVFCDGWIHIQVSTALRDGPSSKLHRKSLVDHLQSHRHWIPCLPDCYGRRFSTEEAILSAAANNPTAFGNYLVFGGVSTLI